MRRLKLKLIVILIIFTVIFILIFIDGYFSSRVKKYITQEVTLTSSKVIKTTIEEGVLKTLNHRDLIVIEKINDKTSTLYINTNEVNEVLKSVNEVLENIVVFNTNIDSLYLPFSIIFSDIIFQKGPNIKIDVIEVGSYKSDVKTNLRDFGINNTLFELYIEVSINYEAIIPMVTEEIQVITKIPIVIEIIQGEIPNYYYQNSDSKYIPIQE